MAFVITCFSPHFWKSRMLSPNSLTSFDVSRIAKITSILIVAGIREGFICITTYHSAAIQCQHRKCALANCTADLHIFRPWMTEPKVSMARLPDCLFCLHQVHTENETQQQNLLSSLIVAADSGDTSPHNLTDPFKEALYKSIKVLDLGCNESVPREYIEHYIQATIKD